MKRWKRHHKIFSAFLALVLVLACSLFFYKLYLAHSIKARLDGYLDTMSAYDGHIDSVDVSLLQVAYRINGMTITKKGGTAKEPFFEAPWIDVGLDWQSFHKGRVLARVVVGNGQLNFVSGPNQNQTQIGIGQDWLLILGGLAPVQINEFCVQGGEVHFLDPYGSPPVDVKMEHLHLDAGDLYVRSDAQNLDPGSLTVTARIMDDAQLEFHAAFDPYAPKPTFDYKAGIDGLKLAALNPVFLRYGGMQVQSGLVDVYSEGDCSGGNFNGYVLPTISDLKIMKSGFDPRRMIQKFLVGILVWTFTDKKDQLMAKFPFSGQFKDPSTSIWTAPAYIFENGFTKALPHGLAGLALMEGIEKSAAK